MANRPPITVRTFQLDNAKNLYFEVDVPAISVSSGPPSAGDFIQLGPDGKIDPSFLPTGGSTQAVVLTLTAGETINAYRAISVHSDGLAYYADYTVVADADRTVGISVSSALAGGQVQVQVRGEVDNVGFNFLANGVTIYLGSTGLILQTPPPDAPGTFSLPLGIVISASRLDLQIGLPIILTG